MYRFQLIILLFGLSLPILAADKCALEGLKEYDFIFVVDRTSEVYSSKIYLPDIEKVRGEFCGYWSNSKLTNNKKHQFYGYKDDHSYITLSPETPDQGFGIKLRNNSQWVQSGELEEMGYASHVVGSYKIVAKQVTRTRY